MALFFVSLNKHFILKRPSHNFSQLGSISQSKHALKGAILLLLFAHIVMFVDIYFFIIEESFNDP